jgi:hypothetical protein
MVDYISALSNAFAAALPSMLTAILFIVAGYIVGVVGKVIISKLINKMGLDEWFEEQNLLAAIGNRNISEIAGLVAKWYIFFIFLKQAVELVNLITLNDVLGFWIQYVLLAIVAVSVIIGGMIIGRFARNAIEATKHSLSRIFGLGLELVVVYIAVVMAIDILMLPTTLLEFAFLIGLAGIVLAVSLMVGIGFGLALKEEAKSIIKELKKPTKK